MVRVSAALLALLLVSIEGKSKKEKNIEKYDYTIFEGNGKLKVTDGLPEGAFKKPSASSSTASKPLASEASASKEISKATSKLPKEITTPTSNLPNGTEKETSSNSPERVVSGTSEITTQPLPKANFTIKQKDASKKKTSKAKAQQATTIEALPGNETLEKPTKSLKNNKTSKSLKGRIHLIEAEVSSKLKRNKAKPLPQHKQAVESLSTPTAMQHEEKRIATKFNEKEEHYGKTPIPIQKFGKSVKKKSSRKNNKKNRMQARNRFLYSM